MNNKNLNFIMAIKHIVYLSEFGLSLVLPIVIFVFLGFFLKNHFEWNNIVVFIFLVVGIACSVINMIFFIKKILKDSNKKFGK